MAGFRAVLYDWDGTLLDSASVSLRTYERLFAAFGIAFGPAEFERTYSPNWHRTYEGMGLPLEQWDAADSLWLDFYSRDAAALLPGAAETLERLARAGFVQGLVSSGSRPRIERDLVRLRVLDFFSVVVCGGDTPNRKPHPEPLLHALDRLGLRPEQVAYVGDSPEDIEMARAAGAFSIGIPGAFPNRDALVASRPDVLAGSLEAAVRRLESAAAAR